MSINGYNTNSYNLTGLNSINLDSLDADSINTQSLVCQTFLNQNSSYFTNINSNIHRGYLPSRVWRTRSRSVYWETCCSNLRRTDV